MVYCRISALSFFSAIVGGGLIPAADAVDRIILDCYWLARWYHQSPDYFLAMPLSDVQRHIMRSHQLTREMEQAAEDDG